MRIAIDTGGTFTDCVYLSGDSLKILKTPSTPADPGKAVLSAIEQIEPGANAEIRHGTTVGTNALLERKGARVAFVTTAGFEDSVAIGRQNRPNLYDWFVTKESPLAPASRRFGVAERTLYDGSILQEPTADELQRLCAAVRAAAPESIAVSLLFSFANPSNERAVAAALEPLGVPVSVSHRILPEFREYERGSTVLINAYLAPKMQSYLSRLEDGLRERGASLHVMQSSGGIIPAAVAASQPVRTILSGPAGGVVGALALAQAAGIQRILTFDMGGTSTDVALVDSSAGAALHITTESQVLGMPVAVPMLDVHTVGAGGGSIARFDRGGALQVGPQSAGADPGPVCYGRSSQPTVTDANLILGRLDPMGLLGGGMPLDRERAVAAFEKAKGSLPSSIAFADGIVRLADATMEKALRRISVERGHDPREFTLVCFGGAGPLHACALARALRIPRVMAPPMPGALSALGILMSGVVRDYSRTVMLSPGDERLARHYSDLERQGAEEFLGEGLQGISSRSADLRYAGQGYEITVPWGGDISEAFHAAHAQRYGYADRARSVQAVNVRVRMRAVTEQPPLPESACCDGDASQAVVAEHPVYFERTALPSRFYDRSRFRPGDRLAGPAVVLEYSATTLIPPGCTARVDGRSNLMIDVAL